MDHATDIEDLKSSYCFLSDRQQRRIIKNNFEKEKLKCRNIKRKADTSVRVEDVENLPEPSTSFDLRSSKVKYFHGQEDEIINLDKVTPSESHNVISNNNLISNLGCWASNFHISQNAFNALLKILTTDVHLDLPRDGRTILKSKYVEENLHNIGGGNYYHIGLQKFIDKILEEMKKANCLPLNRCLQLEIGIDGLPISKSSNTQFWPILGCINNVGPFPIGIYCGNTKPENLQLFLMHFVNEFKKMCEIGILFEHIQYDLKLTKIICDAPAKSYILGIRSHNAYFGCTKCQVEGDYVNNRVCYLQTDCNLRTNAEFRSNVYEIEDFHKEHTPLLSIDFDLIKCVPLDYMHLVCIGVMKRLLQFWVKGNVAMRISIQELKQISSMLKEIRSAIPIEFSRLPRPIEEYDKWKATELRLFLLYIGPIVLKDHLPKDKYIHFLTLHSAMRILASDNLCQKKKFNDYSKKLLVDFVEKYKSIYGAEYIGHNVHNLIHINEDVLNFGNLDSFSAFKYENYLHEIKLKLKCSRYPLQQVVRRILEEENYKSYIKNDFFPKELKIIRSGSKTYYKSIQLKKFKVALSENDCYFGLNDKSIVKIEAIFSINDIYYISCTKLPSYNWYFEIPCKSSYFNCFRSSATFSTIQTKISINDLEFKYLKYKDFFISLTHKI